MVGLPSVTAVVGMLWVAGCPAAAPGEHAPRSHIAHKRHYGEGKVTTKGPRTIRTLPPLLTQSTRGQHQAQRQQLLATESGGHTTRGEEREDGMDGEGRGQRAPRRKRSRANGQCQSKSPTYHQLLESSGYCGLQDAGQQRQGGVRAEFTHRTQAKQRGGRSHHEGPSKYPHTTPLPKPRGGSTKRRDSSCAGYKTRSGSAELLGEGNTQGSHP